MTDLRPFHFGAAEPRFGYPGASFTDVHSHVLPSGDDGARSMEDGLALCQEAAAHGTRTLYATPHLWPHEPWSAERHRTVREAYCSMISAAALFGLELKLGFELSPARWLLDEDPWQYAMGDVPAVLMELPFRGSLALAERLGTHIEESGLLPIVAHPERAEAVLERPGHVDRLRERGWLIQVNATSLLGYHGPEEEEIAWRLLGSGQAEFVASDGHRPARPVRLDAAYDAVVTRVGEGATLALFDGSALPDALRSAETSASAACD